MAKLITHCDECGKKFEFILPPTDPEQDVLTGLRLNYCSKCMDIILAERQSHPRLFDTLCLLGFTDWFADQYGSCRGTT